MIPKFNIVRQINLSRMNEIAKAGDQKWQIYLAAKEYIDAGIYVLPLIPNGKSLPYKEYSINYGSASRKPEIIDKWFHPNVGKFAGWNIGLATGKKDGVFAIDVDVHGEDNGIDNLIALENKYGALPSVPVQQTPSGGKHFLFLWQENAASSTGKIAPAIDTRGGTEKASKGHIVAFPSTVGGKRYMWETGGEILHLPPWIMEKMGVTWKIPTGNGDRGNENVTEDDLEQKVPLEQLERMLESISLNSLSYDEWLRIGMAIKSQYPGDDGLEIWDKWSKKGNRYKPNECDTRWHGFSEFGSVRMGTLFFYAKENGFEPKEDDIRPNKYDVLVEKMNKTFAIVTVGGKIRVLREKDVVTDPVTGHYDLMSKDDFRTLLQNDTMTIADAKGNPKVVSVADIWLAHRNRRTYPNGMGLFPDGKAPPGWFNTWNGFSVNPRKGECGLLLSHIKEVICSNNSDHYEWLLDWCADAVQDPGNPKGAAVIMRGEEGAGKGTLADTMGQLFGSHYRHLIDDSHLLSNFNAHMIDALFVFADEITWGGNVKSSGKLKGMVTEKYLVGERKGVDAIGYKNMKHIMIASNGDWVIPAGKKSRRWFVLDVSEHKIGNKEHFDSIVGELKNGGTEAFLWFLLNREITHNLRLAPETKALKEQRIRSDAKNQIVQWWINTVESGEIEVGEGEERWPEFVGKKELYNHHVEWCVEMRIDPAPILVFYIEAKKRLNLESSRIRVEGERVSVYKIPELEKARKTINDE